MSRELGALLDVENPIDRPYHLEVSSPGLDRRLRQKLHFLRYLGHQAKVTLRNGINGRRKFKGTLLSIEESNAGESPDQRKIGGQIDNGQIMLVVSVDGAEFRLPFDDIDNARLVPDWNSLFQRRGQQR